MQSYIADIIKSYVDWADKEAIVVFFAGCDFRCPFCYRVKTGRFTTICFFCIDNIISVDEPGADIIKDHILFCTILQDFKQYRYVYINVKIETFQDVIITGCAN